MNRYHLFTGADYAQKASEQYRGAFPDLPLVLASFQFDVGIVDWAEIHFVDETGKLVLVCSGYVDPDTQKVQPWVVAGQ